MALTVRTYTSDGIQTIYPIDFDLGYIRREFVYVYDGDDHTFENQLEYTWINNSQIELDSPVPAGETFKIRRVIPRNEPINDYEDGAILRESNLDNSFAQAIMIIQEIQDGYFTTAGEAGFNSDINMSGKSMRNLVTDLLDSTSAITLGDSDTRYLNVLGDIAEGTLGGINATESNHFMPRAQVTETIDERMASAPEFDPENFIDFGLVTSEVGDTLDYGSI